MFISLLFFPLMVVKFPHHFATQEAQQIFIGLACSIRIEESFWIAHSSLCRILNEAKAKYGVLCLIMHQVMRTYGEEEIQSHSFFQH
jgi:hypothetical protein